MSDQSSSQQPPAEPGRDAPAELAPDAPTEQPVPVPPPETGQSPASPPAVPPTPPPAAPPGPAPAPTFGTTEPGPATYESPQSSAAGVAAKIAVLFPADRPEIGVGAAFAGGLVLALILKRLGN